MPAAPCRRRLALQRQEARYQRQAVLDTVIDLAHQELLLLQQKVLLVERVQQLAVQVTDAARLPDIDDRHAQVTRSLNLRQSPAPCTTAHRLLPSMETGAWVQRSAGVQCHVLMGVAGPVHDLDLLGAEPSTIQGSVVDRVTASNPEATARSSSESE